MPVIEFVELSSIISQYTVWQCQKLKSYLISIWFEVTKDTNNNSTMEMLRISLHLVTLCNQSSMLAHRNSIMWFFIVYFLGDDQMFIYYSKSICQTWNITNQTNAASSAKFKKLWQSTSLVIEYNIIIGNICNFQTFFHIFCDFYL